MWRKKRFTKYWAKKQIIFYWIKFPNITDNPHFAADLWDFLSYPLDDEIFYVNDKWERNIAALKNYYENYTIRVYSYTTSDNYHNLGIIVEPEFYVEKLSFKIKPDTSLPTWALILILLAVAIVLGAFCCFLLCTEKGRKIGECIISCGEFVEQLINLLILEKDMNTIIANYE